MYVGQLWASCVQFQVMTDFNCMLFLCAVICMCVIDWSIMKCGFYFITM